jgi:small-conductance mechanosensitive channel
MLGIANPDWWQFLDEVVFGNTIQQWLIAAATTVAALFALATLRRLVAGRAGRFLAGRSQAVAVLAGRLLQRTSWLLVASLSVWFGSRFLALTPGVHKAIQVAVVATLAFQAIAWSIEAMEFGLQAFLERRRGQRAGDDVGITTAAPALRFVGRLIVVVAVVLLALQNLGIDVTAMIAGLGVGGVAVALAVQNILGDLFASLSIVLDRPFLVGDFIVVGERMGTVEHIGLKTTRVRSLSGEQIIFANSDLLSSRIQNFKRMRERRVELALGVTWQTPLEMVARLPGVLRECIEEQQRTRFERAHFKGYGASSLELEAVYWVLDPDQNVHMDLQQAILLAIGRRFQELGVEFALPTQTVLLARANGHRAAAVRPGANGRERTARARRGSARG